MALRFQVEDEVETVKKERFGSAWLSLVLILSAAGLKGRCLLSGGCSTGLEGLLGWIIALCVAGMAVKVILTDLDGLDARTKEIDGKMSAVESTVSEATERHSELLERLDTLQTMLDTVQRELESRIEPNIATIDH